MIYKRCGDITGYDYITKEHECNNVIKELQSAGRISERIASRFDNRAGYGCVTDGTEAFHNTATEDLTAHESAFESICKKVESNQAVSIRKEHFESIFKQMKGLVIREITLDFFFNYKDQIRRGIFDH